MLNHSPQANSTAQGGLTRRARGGRNFLAPLYWAAAFVVIVFGISMEGCAFDFRLSSEGIEPGVAVETFAGAAAGAASGGPVGAIIGGIGALVTAVGGIYGVRKVAQTQRQLGESEGRHTGFDEGKAEVLGQSAVAGGVSASRVGPTAT